MELAPKYWQGKKVFLTGHTGFKGSWLALWLQRLGAEVKGLSLTPDAQPNHYQLLNLSLESQYGDIRNPETVSAAIASFKPDVVFHLAAQSLVRRSYKEPQTTYATNVMGTLNLLEACRATDVKVVIVVTSDKVYENREWIWPYRETDALGGHDLYSSSKACAELLTASYRQSFFPQEAYGKRHQTLVATVRAGNVIGGGDWAEDRLIPDLMKATSQGQPVVIRNPQAVRPWQHVLDPLAGYIRLAEHLLEGQADLPMRWNFGPDAQSFQTVKAVWEGIRKAWPAARAEFPDLGDQPHEAKLLSVDSSQARNLLGWRPVWSFDATLRHTASWYRQFYEAKTISSETQLAQYQKDQLAHIAQSI